jgi:hypothetical protein
MVASRTSVLSEPEGACQRRLHHLKAKMVKADSGMRAFERFIAIGLSNIRLLFKRHSADFCLRNGHDLPGRGFHTGEDVCLNCGERSRSPLYWRRYI